MATISIYVDGESKRKRRRSKWVIPILIGGAAAYAASRAKAPVALPAAPIVVRAEVITPPVVVPPPPVVHDVPIVAPASSAPPAPVLPAHLVITPARIDFGEVPMTRAAAPQLTTIRNDGGQPARLSTAIDGPFIGANGCRGVLAPGAECVVAVVFAPRQPGKFAGALQVTSDGDRRLVPLRGSVPVPPPPPVVVQAPPPVVIPAPPKPPARQLCFNPAALHFTSTGAQAITLTNPENAPLRVTSIVPVGQSGQSVSGYEVDARRCIRILKPRQQCRFAVRATHLALQMRETMTITVYYEDPATGERRSARRSSACGTD